ncbi:hypothetical protein [Pseudomonas leptonychotis]|uniref:phosphorylase family protein n=1 Tax=Pseudomonas leptonychotis TaxID=2448482 RepID=UPI00386658C5
MNIKVLVVEDSASKADIIIRELQKQGVETKFITVAVDAVEARKALKEQAGSFQLMLLDLRLPARSGETPDAKVGLELLRMILEDGEYYAPDNIVGTTADSSAMSQLESHFKQYTTQILMVTPEDNDWKFSLEKLLSRIDRAAQQTRQYVIDACFVTALRKPELQGVLALPISWSPEESLGNGVLFQEGFASIGGVNRRFICAHSTQMGMVAATFMVRALWERFLPKLIIMTGICGGLRDACLGDVIVAERSWDWQSGKWPASGEFEAAPDHKEANAELVALARGTDEVADSFWSTQESRPSQKPIVRVGPMVSGSAVVEDPKKHELFTRQHRKAIAVDMECFGFYFTSEMSSELKPKALCVKAVSDLADRNKSDNYQDYCSHLSAVVAFEVVRKYFAIDARL